MTNLKKLTLTAMLTALAIVFGMWFKIPLISDIKLDLSYIVITIAIIYLDIQYAMFVAGMSAFLGSLLFSAYGISYSWILANLAIVMVAAPFKKRNTWVFAGALILAGAIGMLGVKTAVECVLYNIPVGVKLIKNFVAFISDTIGLLIGLLVYKVIGR